MVVNINGLNINYEVSGEGEPVLLLHGWGGILSFKPVFDFLSRYFKVYVLDFPGFGDSDVPPETWGVEEYSDLIKKFIEKMDISKTNIIAHSFGGRVSIILSSKYPEMINKLILVDSSGLIKKRKLNYYIKVYIFKLLKRVYLLFIPNDKKEEYLERFYSKFGSKDYQESGKLRKIFVKVVNENLIDYLPNIKAQTLLIWGENDTETPVSFGEIMNKKIPHSELIVLKNAGHFSYLDKFNDFCAAVMRFLKDEAKI